ncbi:MAG: hypothetical protein WCS85_00565 [Candidatus Peribacteraceae bacterium]|jgi:hypothetical protein
MQQYSSFTFDSYAFDPETGTISLRYSLDDDVRFEETIILPQPESRVTNPDSLGRALRALHLIGGISYYKTCLPKTIEVRTGVLTEEEATFWNTVYEKGLGEFFFRNDIDFRGLIRFPSSQQPPNQLTSKPANEQTGNQQPTTNRILVPIGGGKDSIVTAELLKKAGFSVTLLRIGAHPLIEQEAKIAGLPLLAVTRKLPPVLFRLNEEGALNGHVPITAYLSFLSVVIAELYGFDAVVMSNERSASVGNVSLHGMEVNHQWSKSLEFERLFRSYVAESIGSGVEYFSLLRPLSELAIAQRFTKLPQYFGCTTSCNTNWKIVPKSKSRTLWCGSCPKCAFVFTLLAAFLPKETLLTMFGKNLYEDAKLLPLYRQLLGLEGMKPFECVGTPEETAAAFMLARERKEFAGTPVMKLFEEGVLPGIKNGKKLIASLLEPAPDHCLPPTFKPLIL